jgi:hypothetical protein
MTRDVAVPENVKRLLDTVLEGDAAKSPAALRQGVADYAAALSRGSASPPPVPANLEAYVRKVACNAYKVLDRDVEALRAAGYSVDDLFEITVAAAVGASLARMEAGLAALEQSR